jgi:hypothetical protein
MRVPMLLTYPARPILEMSDSKCGGFAVRPRMGIETIAATCGF